MIYLVRHAHAGDRSRWDGDDRERPLSAKGWRQANALAERIAPLAPAGLWSSPYVRCRQTLEPLAERTGLPIGETMALNEGAPVEDTLDLLAGLDNHSVCSSHGDVIPTAIEALYRRGLRLSGEADWRKATVWVLDRDGAEFVSASVWSPPVVTA